MKCLQWIICLFFLNAQLQTDSLVPQGAQPIHSVGIDLGTTYSLVSIALNGFPKIIPIEGFSIVPSVVSFTSDRQILVGRGAVSKLNSDPKNTFTSIKRLMGITLKEAKMNPATKKLLSKVSKSDVSSLCMMKCPNRGNNISPVEISSEILKKLIREASLYLGEKISNGVITVPAYFTKVQRDATEEAAKLAGLQKIKILREPEAAALAYGLTQRQPQLVLVFDLGGGTFDVSVLEVGGGFVEVIATSGDSMLGGDDFDEVVANWLEEQYSIAANTTGNSAQRNLQSNTTAMLRIRQAAIEAKLNLSNYMTTTIILPELQDGIGLETILTRKKFESLCKNLLMKLLKPLREVAVMAGVNLPGESGKLSEKPFVMDELEDTVNDIDDNLDKQLSQDVQSLGGQSILDLGNAEVMGRKNSKMKKKVEGASKKELQRVRRSSNDASLALFPSGEPLDDVIMVGGSTRIPAVQRLVRVVTGIKPKRAVNPDAAVCLGAGIYAGVMDGTIEGLQVMTSWQAALYRTLFDEKNKLNITSSIASEKKVDMKQINLHDTTTVIKQSKPSDLMPKDEEKKTKTFKLIRRIRSK